VANSRDTSAAENADHRFDDLLAGLGVQDANLSDRQFLAGGE
jgi:hypothetical protein